MERTDTVTGPVNGTQRSARRFEKGPADRLIHLVDLPSRILVVEEGHRVAVRHNGRILPRLLRPGVHMPLFGLPLLGNLEVVVFSDRKARQAGRVAKVRLQDEAFADFSYVAWVRLDAFTDEEVLDWLREFETTDLSDTRLLSRELDFRVRRSLSRLTVAQLRHRDFDLPAHLERDLTGTRGGFLEIVAIEQAAAVGNVTALEDDLATRHRVQDDLYRRAERLAGAVGDLRPATGDDLQLALVDGRLEWADRELGELARLCRTHGLTDPRTSAALARCAATVVGAALLLRPGDAGHRRRSQEMIMSSRAWEVLLRVRPTVGAAVTEALRDDDPEAALPLLGAVFGPLRTTGDPAPSRPWEIPSHLVRSPAAQRAAAELTAPVAGCWVGASPMPGEEMLFLVAPDPGAVLKELNGDHLDLVERAGADRLLVLPLEAGHTSCLPAWFYAIVGHMPGRVTAAAAADGTVLLGVSPEIRARDVPRTAVAAFAGALCGLTGAPGVAFVST
ncbi:hypothetical protein [Sinosporangium siamense]|uniref:Uncharacterized protein n=1 Tax=Sinosporangium siamense TaxID=1367973 RepID=A0A919RP14_9ACTN|nr:hypothetical protein [Sinosporangium siamense]GII97228.1 hypothetical protein Ssi02_74590 [Sinosporangium siamense]